MCHKQTKVAEISKPTQRHKTETNPTATTESDATVNAITPNENKIMFRVCLGFLDKCSFVVCWIGHGDWSARMPP